VTQFDAIHPRDAPIGDDHIVLATSEDIQRLTPVACRGYVAHGLAGEEGREEGKIDKSTSAD
jgi:hypothetical protein